MGREGVGVRQGVEGVRKGRIINGVKYLKGTMGSTKEGTNLTVKVPFPQIRHLRVRVNIFTPLVLGKGSQQPS